VTVPDGGLRAGGADDDESDADWPDARDCDDWRASILATDDWTELDLDPATRHRSIRKSVRDAVRRKTVRQPDAVRVIRHLEQLAKRAHDDGAFYCASLVVADDPARSSLVSNVTMQLVPCDLGGELAFRTPPDMCGWLSQCFSDEYGEYGDSRLADGHHVDVWPKLSQESLDEGDVVIEVEGPGGERNQTRIHPVGHVDVVVRKELLHRLPQQGGVVPREGSDEEDLRV